MWRRALACALFVFLAGCQSSEMQHARNSERFILQSPTAFWNRPGDSEIAAK